MPHRVPRNAYARGFLEQMLDGCAYCRIVNEQGRPLDFLYLEVNPAHQRVTGLADVVGKRASSVLPDVVRSNPELFEACERVAGGHAAERLESYVPGLDLWFSITLHPAERNHFVAMFDNITQQKRNESALKRAASVFLHSGDGAIIADASATILAVNPAFSEITGYSAGEAIGKKPSLLKSDHHGPDFYRTLWGKLLAEGCWEGEIWNRRKSGEAYLEWLTINAVKGPDGRPESYIAVFKDITKSWRDDERIRHLAFHDPLTGLANRALLSDRLNHAMDIAHREHMRMALLFIDLDHYKEVNDTLGHNVGDQVLAEVGNRLSQSLRHSDTVARLGGDEFVALLEDAGSLEDSSNLAAKILVSIARPMIIEGHTVKISASIGVACFPEHASDPAVLIKRADAAMYVAKAAGRATYRFSDLVTSDTPALSPQDTNRSVIRPDQPDYVKL